MPLRFLWYLSKLYSRYVDKNIIYCVGLVKIPAPEFYVLYNGTADVPDFQELKLSDAYEQASEALELKVQCYNINYEKGKELFDSCNELKAYSIFVQRVRIEQAEGLSLFSAVKAAIRYCESHDLMTEFFNENKKEVYDMVSFKWDANKAKEIAAEEGRAMGMELGLKQGIEKGLEKGRQEGKASALSEVAVTLLKKSYPLPVVADITHLTAEEIRKIVKENGLAC